MLGSEQSTKWKPHPLLDQAKNIGLWFMIIFISITGIAYLNALDKTILFVGSMFAVVSIFPAALYFAEVTRLASEREALKISKSNKSSVSN
ncbi:hypothetical protein RZ186_003633 [Vibrio cholerae]|uniref:hypothetical protein n=1 Tax=Vibrio cholerae TaxID=666 RepID=UPI0011F13BEA|nr:hypothetical protein [Vibrio cholerae]EJX7572352.1 hypothetical protein [Vibrio cholerae]EKG0020395.1 hypothetical protein [Vibrio cholerae]ELN7718383.1 hypothetical protein [Vibrio cholerae]QEO42689.1 hypothetical protein F0316_13925 [Vibrio cholerae]